MDSLRRFWLIKLRERETLGGREGERLVIDGVACGLASLVAVGCQ